MSDIEASPVDRLIDANLNRVAEALRVAEDVCRFHWSLGGFASDLKSLRHEILTVSDTGPGGGRRARIRSRDISGDVGKETPSPSNPDPDLPSLAFRNLQRAKEALRALEETFRLHDAGRPTAGEFQRLRYRLYAIEKGLACLTTDGSLRKRVADCRLMLLVGTRAGSRPIERVVEEAIRAGVDAIQLREKVASDREVLEVARNLREITLRAGTLFVVNDRPDLASLSLADGVHVGQEDLAIPEARSVVGARALVGVSTHAVDQARQAERDGADYLGIGPTFPSPTKDAGPLVGPEGLGGVLGQVSIPAFAIGGITAANVGQLRAHGCVRIAVSSAVLEAADVSEAVGTLMAALGTRH